MATRRIVEIGDEKLRKHAKKVEKFDLRLRILLKDMADTMYKADGVGLAAPQVGILKRAVVVDVGEGLIELVNPVIVSKKGKQGGPEGCLSLPGVYEKVERPARVLIKAQDLDGKPFEMECDELMSVCVQHETDHLNGIVFVDHLRRLKKSRTIAKLAKLRREKAREAKEKRQ